MSFLVFILGENVSLTIPPRSSAPSLALSATGNHDIALKQPQSRGHTVLPSLTLLSANLEKLASSPLCL